MPDPFLTVVPGSPPFWRRLRAVLRRHGHPLPAGIPADGRWHRLEIHRTARRTVVYLDGRPVSSRSNP